MSEHEGAYKITEVVGTSEHGFDTAVENAIERANQTLENLRWFEVVEERGRIADDGTVEEFQVKLDIGFKLQDA